MLPVKLFGLFGGKKLFLLTPFALGLFLRADPCGQRPDPEANDEILEGLGSPGPDPSEFKKAAPAATIHCSVNLGEIDAYIRTYR